MNNLLDSGAPRGKHCSADEFWAFTQRFLSFDEPEDRFKKLQELLSRACRISLRNVTKQDLQAQIDLFVSLYRGGHELSSAERFLTYALIAQDFKRFENITFLSWARYMRTAQPKQPWPWSSDSSDMNPWFLTMQAISPLWSRLREPGPWQNDSRCSFLLDCLVAMKNVMTTKAAVKVFADKLQSWRGSLPGTFLPKIILLVEGQTEAILVPHFLRCLDFDVDANAIAVVASGGSSQVLRRFLDLRISMTVPLMAVLDADAEEPAEIIMDSLRDGDSLYIIKRGEIEDILPDALLLGAIDTYSAHHLEPIDTNKIVAHEGQRTELLDKLWRERGLGDFDKIGFANTIANKKLTSAEVPREITEILASIHRCLKYFED